MPDLLGVIKTARAMTDRVLVAYSGGKDSVVTLDLCCRHFPQVEAFFLYKVPGLEFEERSLRWAEAKYGLQIMRLPHFVTSCMLRDGDLGTADSSVAAVTIADIYAHVRKQTGTYWIAAGERIADSLVRRAMILHDGTINDKRGRIFPVAYWTKAHVMSYIKQRGLYLGEWSCLLGHSNFFGPKKLSLIKQHYPADYQRIIAMYPLAEAGAKWQEFYGSREADE